jgi:hypothetical protein
VQAHPLRHAFTIRVLELRRGHDSAQLQDQVTGPLNRSVPCEGRLAEPRIITLTNLDGPRMSAVTVLSRVLMP